MGKEPDEIRRDIDETRGRLGETVEAIGHKADVTGRAKEFVSEKKHALVSTVSGAGSRVGEATPDGQEVKRRARRAAGVAQENPLGLALGSVSLGFLIGMVVPSSGIEDERIGPAAEEVKESARETGREALERGKHVAQEAAQTAAETAKETGREEGQELASSLKETAQQTASSGRSKPGQ